MSVLKKSPENELIELLRRNGHVAFNNQTDCRPLQTIFESKQTQKPESLLRCGGFLVNSCNFTEDEATSQFQGIVNNTVDKEVTDFFYGMPTSEPGKGDINAHVQQSFFHPQENVAYPQNSLVDDDSIIRFSKPGMTDFGIAARNFSEKASSCKTTKTILSSICETKNSELGSLQDHLQAKIHKPVTASLSGGSSFSFVRKAPQITTNHGYKRKERNEGKSDGHNEEAEYESSEESKRAHRMESGRRSRAAEVHNLSERRRRDRINEKMRELQDLIPHSNKIDKVSVLDEAIEYLKSLQLQLQSLWMRSGMVPVLFPSVHRRMSCMNTGMNHHYTSTRSPIQLPKAPPNDVSTPGTSILNQPPANPLPVQSSINFSAQVQNCHLPDQYSSYLGFSQMQVSQVTSMCTYGPEMM